MGRVRDRYYWIKEGAKFISDGTDHNRFSPELNYEIGGSWAEDGNRRRMAGLPQVLQPRGRQYEGVPENEKGDPDPRTGADLIPN
ncbi:MAG: hypothetical protein Ct9H300mP1_20950 [Planctomycetaceae bacterium]|nr:MAG: hypothetical protein Ct9H300mP1_20950 [Planctomycetaceae bacterium]